MLLDSSPFHSVEIDAYQGLSVFYGKKNPPGPPAVDDGTGFGILEQTVKHHAYIPDYRILTDSCQRRVVSIHTTPLFARNKASEE